MRKNTARHWLHAALDLLPVILIPVFMIYCHRHDLSTDITIQQDVYKDFYQNVLNGQPNNVNVTDQTIENWDLFDSGYGFTFNDNVIEFDTNTQLEINIQTQLQGNTDDVCYISFYNYINGSYDNFELSCNDFRFQDYGLEDYLYKYEYLFNYVEDTNNDVYIYFDVLEDVVDIQLKDIQVFNLTQIFGSGNEPTIEVFESYLKQDYYDFGSNVIKVGTIDVPAKNNDIMSVFMDSFNNSVNKYFNMGNVFNMTSVYQWFNTNIFGGTAPVVIYSVWNIVLYEFVMDLLFLLYGLFMWFIDMCKRLMEKPLDSIK